MKNKKVKQSIGSVLSGLMEAHLHDDSLHRIYFNRAFGFYRPDFGDICGVVSLTADQLRGK